MGQNPAEESDGTKTIKKAMDKFVAKHNEIATRQQNRKRTDDKLNEVEETETKGKHQKKSMMKLRKLPRRLNTLSPKRKSKTNKKMNLKKLRPLLKISLTESRKLLKLPRELTPGRLPVKWKRK